MSVMPDAAVENARIAAGCGASPTMQLVVALASLGDVGIDDAIDRLGELRQRLRTIDQETPRPHRTLAEPPASDAPPVAQMRLEIADHELRGRLLFGELAAKRSFMQVAALSIAGVELSSDQAAVLDEIGVCTQLSDPRIWPLAVAGRIADSGGTLAAAFTAGVATLCTPLMTGPPVAGFMRFLDEVAPRLQAGEAIERVVGEALAGAASIPGVGRPVLRGDERVAPMLRAMVRYGHGEGPGVTLTRRLDRELDRRKGLHVNSAGYFGGLLRDFGFSPEAGAAFSLIYFAVPLLTHAARAQVAGRG